MIGNFYKVFELSFFFSYNHRRSFYFFLVSYSLLGCSKDPVIPNPDHTYYKNINSSYEDTVLNILTYNIQLGFKADENPFEEAIDGAFPQQLHDLAVIIRKSNPNIILLQEVPKDRCNTVVKNFIESLADSLNMNYSFGAHGNALDKCDGTWGNATLSKFPILEIENVVIRAVDKYRTRSVLRTKIKIDDTLSLNVYNLHHDGKDQQEIPNTVDFMSKYNGAVLVGGDFNRLSINPELELLKLDDYTGVGGIDRIYGNLKADWLNSGVIDKSNQVSDHYAIYAHLKLH